MSKTGFNVKLYFTFATQPNTPKGGGMGAFVRQDQYGNVLLQNLLTKSLCECQLQLSQIIPA